MAKIYYIVYDIDTFRIFHTSKWYDKKTHDLQATDGLKYINVTNPVTKETLLKINQINYN